MNLKLIVIICMSLAVLFNSCSNSAEEIRSVENKSFCLSENFKSKIELEHSKMQEVTAEIPLTGVVEANPDKVIHFVSLVGGVISNTYFSLGEKVNKGQVLVELRSTELSDLHARYKTIESQLKVTERELQSVQSMYNDEIASQKDLMEVESKLAVLHAEKEKLSANLNLFSASTEKGVFQIKSPTTGIVTSKNIATGMQISAEGEALFTISDLSEVWVMVNIYATNVVNIEIGTQVNIRTLSYPDEVFQGEISAISHVLDVEAKVLKARVVLQNNELKLKPGMIVDVTALQELEKEAVSIPTSAMVFDNNQNYVVVYKNDCEIEIRKVEILTKNKNTTFLLSGLDENEKIISKNHLLVYEQIKNFQN